MIAIPSMTTTSATSRAATAPARARSRLVPSLVLALATALGAQVLTEPQLGELCRLSPCTRLRALSCRCVSALLHVRRDAGDAFIVLAVRHKRRGTRRVRVEARAPGLPLLLGGRACLDLE